MSRAERRAALLCVVPTIPDLDYATKFSMRQLAVHEGGYQYTLYRYPTRPILGILNLHLPAY
eukprot:SAG31_NODE_2068_length_6521_cov_6.298194_2_plen_62_part_00